MYTLETEVNGAALSSDIFSTKEEAVIAQDVMLKNWGIESKIAAYDSEPADDGYDYDKYQ
jgi:hypothetical protein